MGLADLSLIVLGALFLATAFPRFHLGLTAFPVAFVIAALAGKGPEDVIESFPADFFILILGVTCLFAIAQANGTMEWMLSRGLRLLGGRVGLVPWLIFALTAMLTAVGTLPSASIAIMAPIAMGFSARYGITPFLTALVTVLGMIAGMFSPIAVYGLTAANLYDTAGVETTDALPLVLLAAGLITGLVMCATYVATDRVVHLRRSASKAGFGGFQDGKGAGGTSARRGGYNQHEHHLLHSEMGSLGELPEEVGTATAVRTRPVDTGDTTSVRPEDPRMTMPIGATVAAIAVLVICAVGFNLNVGFVALALTVVLQLALRIEPTDVIDKVPWSVIVLIGGTLTYIGVMQSLGAFERLAQLLSVEGAPLLTLLLICYMAAVTSFFAASLAVFITTVPLLPPLLESGINPVGALIAVAMSALLVDINPLGPTGGYIMAATEPAKRQKLFRQLLAYGIGSVIFVPPIAVAAYSWI